MGWPSLCPFLPCPPCNRSFPGCSHGGSALPNTGSHRARAPIFAHPSLGQTDVSFLHNPPGAGTGAQTWCPWRQTCPKPETSLCDILWIFTCSETDKNPESFLFRQLTHIQDGLKLPGGLQLSRNMNTSITDPRTQQSLTCMSPDIVWWRCWSMGRTSSPPDSWHSPHSASWGQTSTTTKCKT